MYKRINFTQDTFVRSVFRPVEGDNDNIIFIVLKIHLKLKHVIMRFAKVAKQIFTIAVNSVKPSVLITENQLIKFKNIEGKEFIEIVNKCFDITNKKLYVIGFGKAVLSETVELDRVLGNRIVSGKERII